MPPKKSEREEEKDVEVVWDAVEGLVNRKGITMENRRAGMMLDFGGMLFDEIL